MNLRELLVYARRLGVRIEMVKAELRLSHPTSVRPVVLKANRKDAARAAIVLVKRAREAQGARS